MNNTVSIIVPVYNAEKTIERCLRSILNQTYKDIEIIVVNDGSTDKSEELIANIAKTDSRIVLLSGPNCGVSKARNKGLERANGKYIEFVDSDDYIDVNMVSSLVDAIDEVDWSANGYIEHDGERTSSHVYSPRVFHSREELISNIPNLYVEGILNTIWNKLYIREKIKANFNEDISVGEDLLFNLRYIREISSLRIDAGASYQYVSIVSDNNLSGRYHKAALKYLNTQYDEILLLTAGYNSGVNMSDTYTRELLRILRKATNAHVDDDEITHIIDDAATYYRENFSDCITEKCILKIFRSLIENRQYKSIMIIGKITNSVYHLINNEREKK